MEIKRILVWLLVNGVLSKKKNKRKKWSKILIDPTQWKVKASVTFLKHKHIERQMKRSGKKLPNIYDK